MDEVPGIVAVIEAVLSRVAEKLDVPTIEAV